MRDLMNNIHTKVVVAPIVVTDNTAQAGAIIDRKGYESLTYVLLFGTLADVDATFDVTMAHGDAVDSESNPTSITDTAAVAATDLVGSLALAGATFADDGETRKIGYVGGKRYTKITLTPSNNGGNAPVAILAILGNPRLAPTANPPQ